jgi:hypothetical protein
MRELELFMFQVVPSPDSILQHHGPIEFIKEDSKASHSYRSSHIEGDVIQKHKCKKKLKKSEE